MLGSTQQGTPPLVKVKPSPRRRLDRELLVLAIVLIVLIVIAAVVTGGLFLESNNVRSMLLRTCIVGIVAVGQTFVMLSSGIDLSVGGNLILASCFGAALMTTDPRLNIAPGGSPLSVGAGLILMVLVAAGVGTANGFSVSRLRMSPLIVTLAMWQITYGAAYQATNLGQLIANVPESFALFGQGMVGVMPVPVIILIVVVVVGYLILTRTSFGLSIYSVGGSESSAWLSGINIKRVRTLVYIVCGICVGIGAIIALSRTLCGSIRMVVGLELDSIAAVVIGGVSLFGGKGNLIGVVIGVLILSIISNTMTLAEVLPWHQDIIRGAVILGAVIANSVRSK
jgi:ribose transport system permease protein